MNNLIDEIFITILTGSRPELLEKTISFLPFAIVENAYALLNGNDKKSKEVLQFYNIEYDYTNKIHPIGQSISMLAEQAKKSQKKFWLHIEDDWKFVHSENWLNNAVYLLKYSHQVRLRHVSEKVLTTHMITGQVISWNDLPNGYIGNAHFTFNPFLMETRKIDSVFPCEGERHAQRNALKNNLRPVTQLKPGNFYHIGDENSLRLKTKCQV